MAHRLTTGDLLSAAVLGTITLGSWWLSMSGYHAAWPTWVTGIGAVCFAIYAGYLWWKWRHEGKSNMSDDKKDKSEPPMRGSHNVADSKYVCVRGNRYVGPRPLTDIRRSENVEVSHNTHIDTTPPEEKDAKK